MLFCKICEMLHSEIQGGMERVIKVAPRCPGRTEYTSEGELLRSEGELLWFFCIAKCVCVCVCVCAMHHSSVEVAEAAVI